MRLAMIGLGRMGANIARRLIRGGHEVVVFNRSPEPVAALASEGAIPATSLKDAAAQMTAPRIFWVMLPAGAVIAYQHGGGAGGRGCPRPRPGPG